MKQKTGWRKPAYWLAGMLFVVTGILMLGTFGVARDATGAGKQEMQKKAYAVYQQKCLLCHDSVADPEKPGRTRDDWHLVVEVMHGYGLDLTAAESDTIVDLLYHLRKGMEREAG